MNQLENLGPKAGHWLGIKIVVANSKVEDRGTGIAMDYAIYYGPSDWTDADILASGTKMRTVTAKQLAWEIPQLSEQWYNMEPRV